MLRILFALLAFVYAKSVTHTFTIRQLQKSQQLILNKYGSRGVVLYKITSRLINPPKEHLDKDFELSFNFFQQDKWGEALQTEECNRSKKANRIIGARIESDQNQTEVIREGQLVYGKFHNVWIVALDNCLHPIDKVIKANNKNTKLEITVWLFDQSGQEFSLEEEGLLTIVTIMTLFTIIGFYYNYRIFRKEYDKYGEWDYAFLLVIIILGLEAFQNSLNFIHLLVYNSNGRGISPFATISEIIQVLDNYLLMILLILIAWGWSIEFMSIEDWDIYGPLAFLIAFAQALIVGLGKLVSNQSEYHIYEGWVGYSISAIYLLLCFYFYYSVNQRKKKGDVVESFYFQFKLYGMLFFISFPFLLFISKLVDPYKSYKIIILGCMFIRMLNIGLLVRLFIGKSSDYQKICLKGKSFLDRGKIL